MGAWRLGRGKAGPGLENAGVAAWWLGLERGRGRARDWRTGAGRRGRGRADEGRSGTCHSDHPSDGSAVTSYDNRWSDPWPLRPRSRRGSRSNAERVGVGE